MKSLVLHDIKLRLAEMAGRIYPVPQDTPVHDDFLGNMSRADFVAAFSAYRDIVVGLYRKASAEPADFGLTSLDRKSGEEKPHPDFCSALTVGDKLAQVQLFFLRLCDSSRLVDGVLQVGVTALVSILSTFPRVANPDKLMRRLSEAGFEFSGYTGRLSSTSNMSVAHAVNPALVSVIFRFAQSQYARVGMEFDYAHFNPHLLAVGFDGRLGLCCTMVYDSLCEEARQFLEQFDAAMNALGYSHGAGPISGLCWGRSQYAYSRSPEKKKDYVCRLYQRRDTLCVRLYLKNMDAYTGYIEALPESIRDGFTNELGACNFCRPECGHRKTYMLGGTQYVKCDGWTFEFNDLSPEAVPHYVELLRLSAEARRRR